ncbi:hypothetical protein TNCV_771981 [Trichonephila clavipes]|nr:hypothetical protein TNCV_771981 [Trichonephila clavipes]
MLNIPAVPVSDGCSPQYSISSTVLLHQSTTNMVRTENRFQFTENVQDTNDNADRITSAFNLTNGISRFPYIFKVPSSFLEGDLKVHCSDSNERANWA